MNMTVANGCTEDEALSAMTMAAGIATRMGIELDRVQPAGSPKRKLKETFNHMQMKVHEALAGEAAGTLYGVEFNAPNYGKNGYWFIGREENIALAETTMLWLMRQVELLYKTHLPRGLTVSARAQFRATFKQACALRILDRATDMMRDMARNDTTAQANTGSTALVVAGHFAVLKAEIDDHWDQKMKTGAYAVAKTQQQIDRERAEREQLEADYASGRKQRPKMKVHKQRRGRSIKFGNGTDAGFAAGDTVKLRQELPR
jgi:hypothetical protein